eukprot:scaffold13.g398.t1
MAARNAESSRHGKVPLPGPPLILGVWSHKGGTGKSTFAAMVACMLAKKGYKTIMVDADAQQSITFHFAENVINVEEEPEEDEQGEEAEEPAHSAAERDEVGPAAGFALTLPSIRSDRLRNPDTLLAEDFDSMASAGRRVNTHQRAAALGVCDCAGQHASRAGVCLNAPSLRVNPPLIHRQSGGRARATCIVRSSPGASAGLAAAARASRAMLHACCARCGVDMQGAPQPTVVNSTMYGNKLLLLGSNKLPDFCKDLDHSIGTRLESRHFGGERMHAARWAAQRRRGSLAWALATINSKFSMSSPSLPHHPDTLPEWIKWRNTYSPRVQEPGYELAPSFPRLLPFLVTSYGMGGGKGSAVLWAHGNLIDSVTQIVMDANVKALYTPTRMRRGVSMVVPFLKHLLFLPAAQETGHVFFDLGEKQLLDYYRNGIRELNQAQLDKENSYARERFDNAAYWLIKLREHKLEEREQAAAVPPGAASSVAFAASPHAGAAPRDPRVPRAGSVPRGSKRPAEAAPQQGATRRKPLPGHPDPQ